MTKDFRSDNILGCSPEILEAIARASQGPASSYGEDDITARVRKRCCEIFDRDVDVFPVITGTAGNALAIASITPASGVVFCHEDAHIQRDELGAAEFFSGGAKLVTIAGADGKLHPDDLQRAIDRAGKRGCVSLTNATEAGTVYSDDEIRALCDVARRNDLRVHVDGARYANAVVSGAADLGGVDILTLGATKNGVLSADLIVAFRKELAEEIAPRWHRSGHRLSKMRFMSAQLEAYLSNDLWLRNASHANEMARRLRDGIADVVEVVRPVEANIVFVRLPAGFEREGFLFYDWPIFGPDVYRIFTGFSTTADDIDKLIAAIQKFSSNAPTSSR